MKIYVPFTHNLGDMFNVMPVISGIAKSQGDNIDLVVSDKLMVVNGFREFMEFQPCINSLRFRKEVLMMDEPKYLYIVYSQNEFRSLTERPNRPIETMRHELFVRENYPDLVFEVDDNFKFQTDDYMKDVLPKVIGDRYIIGDRWLNHLTDTRRASNVFKSTGLFDDTSKFLFLDYKRPLMDNANIILASKRPFIGTFTGSGMLADLLGVCNYCVWDDSMVNWNQADISYSYWKHFYGDRDNALIHMSDIGDYI